MLSRPAPVARKVRLPTRKPDLVGVANRAVRIYGEPQVSHTRIPEPQATVNEDLDTPEKSSCRATGWGCHDECDVRHFELVRQCDVRGLLHCHTAYDGGVHGLRDICDTALELGLEYLGITDRIATEFCDSGLTPESMAHQREEIALINAERPGFRLLHGVEVETAPDGTLPLDEDWLTGFDYVVATLKDDHALDRGSLTARAVRAVMNPFVSILGHPLGDYMTMAGALPLDIGVVLNAAAEARVAVEIDANPEHGQLDWTNCNRAQDLGVAMIIASDVHRAARLADYRHGTELTRHAGLCCRQVLNTRTADDILAYFRRDNGDGDSRTAS